MQLNSGPCSAGSVGAVWLAPGVQYGGGWIHGPSVAADYYWSLGLRAVKTSIY
jgi:hypothetical protein